MFKKIVFVIFIIVIIFSSLGYHFFVSMNGLPKGEMILETESPNNNYTIRAYLVNEHATVDFCIRCELIYNYKTKMKKNIYWGYREDAVEIEWINDNSVIINGRNIELPNGKYDWRIEI